MLIECRKQNVFWHNVEKWIHLGVREYELTDNNLILGDIEKDCLIISIIILCAKDSMYTAKIKDKRPFFQFIKTLLHIGKIFSNHQQ